MTSFAFNEIGGEKIRLDLEVGPELCAICTLPPPAEKLDLVLELCGERYEATICRFCLSEYAPKLLAEMEGGLAAPPS